MTEMDCYELGRTEVLTVITGELSGVAGDVNAILLVRRVAPSAIVVTVAAERIGHTAAG